MIEDLEKLEDWQLDFHWLQTRHSVQDMLKAPKLPDLQAILFLIGMQELGQMKTEFSKEEKQDLMHIAVCRLLSYDGYYELEGYDADGWPHWKQVAVFPEQGVKPQERVLKIKIIQYFNNLKNAS